MKHVPLALALLLLGPALADHVYSHRIVVDGRLVGADGAPLAGRVVEFFSKDEEFLEVCREGQEPVTDEWGDFRFCFHHHAISPGVVVGVRYGNVSHDRIADVAMRRSTIFLQEPNETGEAPDAWNTSYRISGRAWRPGPMELEGVQVFGEAVIGLPVNLTIRAEGAEVGTFRTETDGFGDFDLVIEAPGDPERYSVSVEAMGRSQPVGLDPTFHRVSAPMYVGIIPTEDGSPPPANGGRTRFDDAPGNTTPRVAPVMGVALAVGLVAAIWLSRRKER